MVVRDKDLFVQGTDETAITPEDIAIAEGDKENPTSEVSLEEISKEAPIPTEAPIEVTPEPTPAPEVETPAPTPAEEKPEEKVEEKSFEEILTELEQIQVSSEEGAKAAEKTTEELKTAVKEGTDTTEIIAKLEQQNLEKDTNNKKLQITVDFLQDQIETLTKENMGYKYGRVDEDGLLQLINNDNGIKSIISGTIKAQSGNQADKDKLIDVYKTQLETLTGLQFDEFIQSSKKKVEAEMPESETDVATNVDAGQGGESLFV